MATAVMVKWSLLTPIPPHQRRMCTGRCCPPEGLLSGRRRKIRGDGLPRHGPDQPADGALMLRLQEGCAHCVIPALQAVSVALATLCSMHAG